MNTKRIIFTSTGLGLSASVALTGVAQAAPNYQAWNHHDSDGTVRIYKSRGCTGGTYDLHPGWVAKSERWDSFLAVGNFDQTTHTLVKVYSKSTGKLLATRKVPDGVCYNMSNRAHKLERR